MIALVHLVWGPLGPEPLNRFLDSYRRHPPGTDHELVLLLNGLAADDPVRAALPDVNTLELAAPALDLTAYAQAAQRLHHDRLCLVNSHSEILVDDWLAKLSAALDNPGTGLAGASGSWASMRSYALFHAGLPSAYRSVYEDRRQTIAAFDVLHAERSGQTPSHNALRRTLNTTLALADMTIGFERFPSHHVRTNAFLLDRETLIATTRAGLRRKVHTHRLESGRHSITRQIERRGQSAVVVDRDGRTYAHDAWPDSETLWQGAQRGLMVADNQTRDYQHGDRARRRLLARYAWGDRAAAD